MASFYLNFNHKAWEPENAEIFLNDIGAPDIDFGSVWCIYQLINALKINIDESGSSADFLKSKKYAAAINLSEGEVAV